MFKQSFNTPEDFKLLKDGMLGAYAVASAAELSQMGAGKIKTCLVSLSGVMPIIPSGLTSTQIALNTVVYDTNNAFSLAGNKIMIPAYATLVSLTAHITFSEQNAVGSNPSSGVIHLFRNGSPTGDIYMHTRAYIAAPTGVLCTIQSVSGWIPVLNLLGFQEYWTLQCAQTTGQPLALEDDGSGEENWLCVNWM